MSLGTRSVSCYKEMKELLKLSHSSPHQSYLIRIHTWQYIFFSVSNCIYLGDSGIREDGCTSTQPPSSPHCLYALNVLLHDSSLRFKSAYSEPDIKQGPLAEYSYAFYNIWKLRVSQEQNQKKLFILLRSRRGRALQCLWKPLDGHRPAQYSSTSTGFFSPRLW